MLTEKDLQQIRDDAVGNLTPGHGHHEGCDAIETLVFEIQSLRRLVTTCSRCFLDHCACVHRTARCASCHAGGR